MNYSPLVMISAVNLDVSKVPIYNLFCVSQLRIIFFEIRFVNCNAFLVTFFVLNDENTYVYVLKKGV